MTQAAETPLHRRLSGAQLAKRQSIVQAGLALARERGCRAASTHRGRVGAFLITPASGDPGPLIKRLERSVRFVTSGSQRYESG